MDATNIADRIAAGEIGEKVPFERLFDATPTLIGVYRGPEHIYLYRNPAHARTFGVRPLIGSRLRDAIPELVTQGIVAKMGKVFEDGLPKLGMMRTARSQA